MESIEINQEDILRVAQLLNMEYNVYNMNITLSENRQIIRFENGYKDCDRLHYFEMYRINKSDTFLVMIDNMYVHNVEYMSFNEKGFTFDNKSGEGIISECHGDMEDYGYEQHEKTVIHVHEFGNHWDISVDDCWAECAL